MMTYNVYIVNNDVIINCFCMDKYFLFRSMKISANGLPVVGATARTLGIRKDILNL